MKFRLKPYYCLKIQKKQKKREIFRVKELKTATAPFLETIPLKYYLKIFTSLETSFLTIYKLIIVFNNN